MGDDRDRVAPRPVGRDHSAIGHPPEPAGDQAVRATDRGIANILGTSHETIPEKLPLEPHLRPQQHAPAAPIIGARTDPVVDERFRDIRDLGAARDHTCEQPVILHERQIAITARRQYGGTAINNGRMIERIVKSRIACDVQRINERYSDSHHIARVGSEFQQSRTDQIGARLNEWHLQLETVRHRHVIGVHSRDHVVAAQLQPGVERGTETAVVLQRHEVDRYRAVGDQPRHAAGEFVVHRTVLDQDHLAGPPRLRIYRTTESDLHPIGEITPVNGDEQGERLRHTGSALHSGQKQGWRRVRTHT